jgi:hypothetical protein
MLQLLSFYSWLATLISVSFLISWGIPSSIFLSSVDVVYRNVLHFIKVKVKALPIQATKALRVGRDIALPYLRPRHWRWGGGQHHAPAVLPPENTRYPLYTRLLHSMGTCLFFPVRVFVFLCRSQTLNITSEVIFLSWVQSLHTFQVQNPYGYQHWSV